MNPLLSSFDTPFQTPPFHLIKTEHYKPAIESLIEDSREEINKIISNDEPASFNNTIEALEGTGRKLDEAAEIFFNLNSAETDEEMQQLAAEISPILTEFNNEIMQNADLFGRVKSVYDQAYKFDLDDEQKMLLTKSYKGFIRSGANLSGADKDRFKEISMGLSKLTLKFGENVLAETNAFQLILEDESDLAGIPTGIKAQAAATAKEEGQEGKWLFSLQAPSYIPFVEYADKRELREKMFRAFVSKSFKGNEYDNQENIIQIVTLRAELAELLSYPTYADYVLEERMAETPSKVNSFLEELLDKSLAKAQNEVEEIKNFISEIGDDIKLERWDWAYYAQKLKKSKFDLNDEMLRPYFKLENSLKGIFKIAQKLYGLEFIENKDIPVYHKDVKAYEVKDEHGDHLSVFYADFFPRKGKRGGAWMTSFRGQWKDEIDHRPVVSIVCNFTPPSENKPSLLTYDEVNTLFHEFGHALHGMLANGKYKSISGTSVFWDFVELPSQIMENWLEEKECLDLFAHHYETGDVIPADLVQKIKDSSKFHAAYQTLRQLSFGMMDLAWHSIKKSTEIKDVKTFESNATAKTELMNPVEGTCMSTQFSHIFHGGYGAGYYSYKWAEVLDADAFSLFKEKGIFDKETAKSFKENILSKGGSEHPMKLYKKFRGQEPSLDALLERSGLN
ncbi:MAG: peptidyl-dipeptidase Dcp [Cyclobacteriaceae bacterium]|jgi:peptidyl-dipeptidase Dcp